MDDKNKKICQFSGREFMSWVRSIKKEYFLVRHLFKAELYVIFISLSLVSICQNYIRLYINEFLDSQCMLARRTSNIKSLVNCPRPPCPYIQVGQERGREIMRIVYNVWSSRLVVLHKKYLVWKLWKIFIKNISVGVLF